MLATVGSSLDHVIHINVFLADMQDFDRMNDAYVEKMGKRRPARTTIAVSGLPKPGALLTMNLTAVTKEWVSRYYSILAPSECLLLAQAV